MIYLDNNATTPLAPQVITAITDCLSNSWSNPSSNYSEGKAAKHLIETARQSIARMINADNDQEIIFTSGGTEANNWVITSSVTHFKLTSDRKPHIITTNIEHDSIREPLEQLINNDIDVTYVPVDTQTGCVCADLVIAAIRPETCLITVMLANNETGVIQPVEEIGYKLSVINGKRVTERSPEVLFHCDAAQGIGKIAVNVKDLAVHYLTVVGHKFYGPRVGALYRRSGSPLIPLLFGGGQEKGLRPGTENTPMIVGLGTAAQLVTDNLQQYYKHFKRLQKYFESQLKQKFGDLVAINCQNSPLGRLPNTTSLAFNKDCLLGSKILELTPNIRASLGAACHSSASEEGKPSNILIASGVSVERAQRTIRLSTGRDTTEQDIKKAIDELTGAIDKLISLTMI